MFQQAIETILKAHALLAAFQASPEFYRKFIERDGKTYVDTRFDRGVRPLVSMWADNLLHQGWSNPERCKVQGEV